MHLEIKAAVNFLLKIFSLKETLEPELLDDLGQNLAYVLCEKYRGHWYPDKPIKGQAFRCIRINAWQYVDDSLLKACDRCGIQYSMLPLPEEITLWIDPFEVCGRFGENTKYFTIATFDPETVGDGTVFDYPEQETSDYFSTGLSSRTASENSSYDEATSENATPTYDLGPDEVFLVSCKTKILDSESVDVEEKAVDVEKKAVDAEEKGVESVDAEEKAVEKAVDVEKETAVDAEEKVVESVDAEEKAVEKAVDVEKETAVDAEEKVVESVDAEEKAVDVEKETAVDAEEKAVEKAEDVEKEKAVESVDAEEKAVDVEKEKAVDVEKKAVKSVDAEKAVDADESEHTTGSDVDDGIAQETKLLVENGS